MLIHGGAPSIISIAFVSVAVFVACLGILLSMTPSRYKVVRGTVLTVVNKHKAKVQYHVGDMVHVAYMYFSREVHEGDVVDVAYLREDPRHYRHPRVSRLVLLSATLPLATVLACIGLAST